MIIQKQIYAGALSYDGVRGGKYYLIDTIPKLEAMVVELEKQPIFAWDTETSGLSIVFDKPCGLSIGWGIENNSTPYLLINQFLKYCGMLSMTFTCSRRLV
jgi:hypothetical protein